MVLKAARIIPSRPCGASMPSSSRAARHRSTKLVARKSRARWAASAPRCFSARCSQPSGPGRRFQHRPRGRLVAAADGRCRRPGRPQHLELRPLGVPALFDGLGFELPEPPAENLPNRVDSLRFGQCGRANLFGRHQVAFLSVHMLLLRLGGDGHRRVGVGTNRHDAHLLENRTLHQHQPAGPSSVRPLAESGWPAFTRTCSLGTTPTEAWKR